MAERDYLDFYDWLHDTGGDPNVGAPPEDPHLFANPQPDAPPQEGGWGMPPGAPRDGYYWNLVNGQWVETPIFKPPTETTPPPGPKFDPIPTGGGGGGVFNVPSIRWGGSWPSYGAPDYIDPGAFDPGPAFSYGEFSYPDFAAPTADDLKNDPGFEFRLNQGRKALEASAAGRGTIRSGASLKNILEYGQNFASQEYGDVYNRALRQYDTNRDNAFGNYSTNRNNASDIWGKQYGQRKDVYDASAQNAFQHNAFNQSNAQTSFNAAQRQAELEFQDAYNRWAKTGDWLSPD